MKVKVLSLVVGFFFGTQSVFGQLSGSHNAAQHAEFMVMWTNLNHGASLVWRETVMERMLAEANWAADRLKLTIKRPIEAADIQQVFVASPANGVLQQAKPSYLPDTIYGQHIFDSDIPRGSRLRALKIGLRGNFATTNFEFEFDEGKLGRVLRLSCPNVEYYARDLDKLVGKPSLINSAQAYQLATQWLAAVDVDLAVLEKARMPQAVHQLEYQPPGAANSVFLPIFYVDWGTNFTGLNYIWFNKKNAPWHPSVEVEILGTTKELQNLRIADPSFSRRLPVLITNVLDLVRTPDPPLKTLKGP
jgi:hypothetical protein